MSAGCEPRIWPIVRVEMRRPLWLLAPAALLAGWGRVEVGRQLSGNCSRRRVTSRCPAIPNQPPSTPRLFSRRNRPIRRCSAELALRRGVAGAENAGGQKHPAALGRWPERKAIPPSLTARAQPIGSLATPEGTSRTGSQSHPEHLVAAEAPPARPMSRFGSKCRVLVAVPPRQVVAPVLQCHAG